MPHFHKEALSKYISTGCKRQLRLNLSPDNAAFAAERRALHLPPVQPPRPGLAQIREAGEEWGAAKVADLADTFGADAVVGHAFLHPSGQTRYRDIPLRTALALASVGQFLAEAEFTVTSAFEQALGIAHYRAQYGLDYGALRPDLIELCPAGSFSGQVLPDGSVRPLPPGDARIGLRVIDVKLTAEPGRAYFAEVAYYAMVLAGWLIDEGLDARYVVAPEAAVWPGSHDATQLVQLSRERRQAGALPTRAELRAALDADLEPVPFAVYSLRLQRLLRDELPAVLEQSWRELPFHVDTRCRSCEYLGYPWLSRGVSTAHPDHCMPTAEQQQHLSRVAFISRGASAALQEQGVGDVAALAARDAADPVFDSHQDLRAGRTVVAGRATALATREAAIPERAGTSAVMPRWADLRVYLSADFDVGSAITLALGLRWFWSKGGRAPAAANGAANGAPDAAPNAADSTNGANGTEAPASAASEDEAAAADLQAGPRRRDQVFVVSEKALAAEERELLAFLTKIRELLEWAQAQDRKATVQFYIWDTLEYEHLVRIMGRHLAAILRDGSLAHLAWLFPPPELLPNPAQVTRRSPLTIVRDVTRALLAAPIPHYYSLLATARAYHPDNTPAHIAAFWVPTLFEDALSDQVPSERAHEIWSRATRPRHWQESLEQLTRTVRTRLDALAAVARRLERDLRPTLKQTAPSINLGPPAAKASLSAHGQLWYAFARLNVALEELEVQHQRAMPVHEREARYESARLEQRLTGLAASAALARLDLLPVPGRMVYRLAPASRETKLREGEFGVALAPETPEGFLDLPYWRLTEGTPLEPSEYYEKARPLERVLGVTIRALDRDAGLIVLDADQRQFQQDASSGEWLSMFDLLERAGLANFDGPAVLDPVSQDFFTSRLLATLEAIGNPPLAQSSPGVAAILQAIGQAGRRGARTRANTPAAEALWAGRALYETPLARDLPPVRARLEAAGRALNPTQWRAWEAALTRRMQVIWGPPGTGKSRTVANVILGAALAAAAQGRGVRVLLAASTYTAIDNVLLDDVYPALADLLPDLYAQGVYRLRSAATERDARIPAHLDVPLERRHPSEQARALWARLDAAEQTTIVGATVQQVHNLLTDLGGGATGEVFDLIVIDEASQLDVAGATLALAALAADGAVVMAGDPLQLAPIQAAEPPLGLEAHVGSIYRYCTEVQGVPALMLDENYRSNATLVDFAHRAGYEAGLRAVSPNLRLDLLSALPVLPPPDWPPALYWTPAWSTLLDPAHPAVCFVYPDGRASQSNPFEADAVAALLWLLAGRLTDRLAGEHDPLTGAPRPPGPRQPYRLEGLWQRGVGVVTPHRAQQGLIVSRLRAVFPEAPPALLRGAVDTVERFQGQQRDVIVASFALGDPDAIAREDEFLLSLNRFNVLASRARAKLIVLVSQEVVDHLSGDLDTLRASRLLKEYCLAFCRHPRPLTLGYRGGNGPRTVSGVLRTH